MQPSDIYCYENKKKEDPLLDGAITTLPKSGTNFLVDLMEVLNIDVAVDHFMLDTELTRAWWGPVWPRRLRTPEQFIGKTVVVIRDLKDCMSSAVFWIKQNACTVIENPDRFDHTTLILAQEFLSDPYDVQLLKVIKSEGMATGMMTLTRYSCDLIDQLIKEKPQSVLIVKFEDFIGIESGGNLCDEDRLALLSDLCSFLGYQRSPDEISIAIEKIFGKSVSYNPVKKKVGRWRDDFDEKHIAAFKEFWESRNLSFQYKPISIN